MNSLLSTTTIALALFTLAGCSSTSQPGRHTSLGENVTGSGFLGDIYPQMKEGEDQEALRLYRNPKFASQSSFTHYNKVLIDPIKCTPGPSPSCTMRLRQTPPPSFRASASN